MATSPLVVSIEARAHLSGGLAEAQAQVKAAMANMAEAQAQFGKAAEQGNIQAAQTLQGYRTELNQAQAALQTLRPAAAAASDGIQQVANSSRIASAELRVMTGSTFGMANAAAQLVSQSELLSGVMAAAFPVFGALGLVGILGTMIEKVVTLTQDWGELQKIQDEVLKQMATDEQQDIAISEQQMRATREYQVALAELRSGKSGRGAAGAAAGDAFDLSVATNNLKILQGQIEATKKTYDDLLTKSKQTGQFEQSSFMTVGSPYEVGPKSDEAEVAAKKLSQVYTELGTQERAAAVLQAEIQAKQTQGAVRVKELGEDAAETAKQMARAAEEIARKNQELVAQVQRGNAEIANQMREISNQGIEYHARLARPPIRPMTRPPCRAFFAAATTCLKRLGSRQKNTACRTKLRSGRPLSSTAAWSSAQPDRFNLVKCLHSPASRSFSRQLHRSMPRSQMLFRRRKRSTPDIWASTSRI